MVVIMMIVMVFFNMVIPVILPPFVSASVSIIPKSFPLVIAAYGLCVYSTSLK
jgi:hypothetical protein